MYRLQLSEEPSVARYGPDAAVACGSRGSAIADRPDFAPRRGRSAVGGLCGGTVAGHATGLQPAITSIDRSLITHAILPAAYPSLVW